MEIYQFFKEQGVEYIQFIPIVERMPDKNALQLGLRHATPPDVSEKSIEKSVSSWTVEAEKYGDFLIAIFDEWVRRDVGKVHVMNFEHALTAWLGLPATSCIFAETCGQLGSWSIMVMSIHVIITCILIIGLVIFIKTHLLK